MPKLEYFVVAESVSVDQSTNRISIFNVVEQISIVEEIESNPTITQMVGVAYWIESEDDTPGAEYLARLVIHTEGQSQQVINPDFSFQFSQNRRARLIFRLSGPPPLKPGILRFELLLNQNHAADHLVHVNDLRATPKD